MFDRVLNTLLLYAYPQLVSYKEQGYLLEQKLKKRMVVNFFKAFFLRERLGLIFLNWDGKVNVDNWPILIDFSVFAVYTVYIRFPYNKINVKTL